MFSSKKTNIPEKKVISRNIIGKGTKIIGNVMSEGDFRIDGVLEGELSTDGKVIIGKEGFIKGTVKCDNAEVEGKFGGKFNVNNILSAKSTANISGEVVVGQISTEPGASFNATCKMTGGVKELSSKNEKKEKQKTA